MPRTLLQNYDFRFAPKGRNITVQGNALGLRHRKPIVALKGRNNSVSLCRIGPCFALSGLRRLHRYRTQGVALG